MAGVETRDFDSPDETRTPDKTKVDVVRMGSGTTAARFTFEPGWKWSDCVKPVANGGKNQHIFTLPVIENCGGCTGAQKVIDFIALRIACDDPTCTRDSCPCPGAFNTWNTAVVDTGNGKGIFNAVEVCDNKPCASVDFSKVTCGPYRGTVLVQ